MATRTGSKKWYMENMEQRHACHELATKDLVALIEAGKVLPQTLELYGLKNSESYKWVHGKVAGEKSKYTNWVFEETTKAMFELYFEKAVRDLNRIERFLQDSSLLGWVEPEKEVEPTVLSEEKFQTPLLGISAVSGSKVAVVGRRKVELADGKVVRQYVYDIMGHTPENGKHFVAHESNIIMTGEAV